MMPIKKFPSLWLLCLMLPSTTGFAANRHAFIKPSLQTQKVPQRADTKLNVFALDGANAFSALDSFFQTEPYLAAFLTCSLKASAADWVAQTQQKEHDVNRNLAFILYGGLYQGCVQTFIFSVLFPFWFPDPSFQSILTQVGIDILILGPMVCMPTVYTMKALFAGEEGSAGIKKYLDHVQNKGILFKYWSIWGPVQTLNFGIIPHHLRVVFVAMVSFFWICLLSTVSSSESEGNEGIKELPKSNYPEMVPVPVLANHAHQTHKQHQQARGGLAHVTSS